MKIRDKIKSYSFWVSLASAVILILKVLGGRFGFTVDETMVSDLFTALCSILVLLGIIVVPGSQSVHDKQLNNIFQLDNNASNTHVNNNPETTQEPNESNSSDLSNDEPSEEIAEEINIGEDCNSFKLDEQQSDKNINLSNEIIENLCDEDMEAIGENNFTENLPEQNPDNIPFNEEMNNPEISYENKPSDVNISDMPNENFGDDSISNVSNLKQLFDAERAKFTKNMNDYILELQEEIRRAREKM